MHAVFPLPRHSRPDIDMGIVNAGHARAPTKRLSPNSASACEDVILNRRPEDSAPSVWSTFAESYKGKVGERSRRRT